MKIGRYYASLYLKISYFVVKSKHYNGIKTHHLIKIAMDYRNNDRHFIGLKGNQARNCFPLNFYALFTILLKSSITVNSPLGNTWKMRTKILGFAIGVSLKRTEKKKNEKLEGDLMMHESP